MLELTDHELLADFARNETEEAFGTLVTRYVNLVYSTALRFTANPDHADEVTQAVFIILARKAGKLSTRVVLSGWLYQTTRLTAANFVKREIRRQRREQEAYMESTLTETDTAAWQQIAPLLDDAMGRLGEIDRNAVVLRFFENKTAVEVAAALRLSEAAAHKRTSRALDKLRQFFTHRGVSSSTGTIAAAISAHSIQTAPAALVKSVTVMATAKGALAGGSILTLVKGALQVMAWTNAKTAIVAGAVVLIAATATTIGIKINQAHRAETGPTAGLVPLSINVTNEVQPDGSMIGHATVQELNTTDKKIVADYIGDSDINLKSVTDEAGRPMKFTRTGPRGYFVTLNKAARPGDKISYSIVANWTGMIRSNDAGIFQLALTNYPGGGSNMHYATVFRLPAGAVVLDKFEEVQQTTNVDQIELGVERKIPQDGGVRIGFSYRLAAANP